MSRPIEEYIELPKQVRVEWIGSEEDVSKLKVLYNQMYIGIDSEWKPTQFSGESHSKPSLLQVSGETEAFLIDLVALEKSKVLDEMLSGIFSNRNSIVIGFGFKSDLEQFQKRLPHL